MLSDAVTVSDGKFILELVRGVARAGGGGGGWVSVPRKTFWPPAGAPGTPPGAPPSAALSLSDDNSSVHSSPWQRDHCWKQNAPRKNLSRELALYYCRPSTLPAAAIAAVSRRARRRPFDASLREPPDARPPNGVRNGDALSPRGEDAVDGAARPHSDSEHDREIYHRMKLKKPHQHLRLRVYRKTRTPRARRPLARTVARLLERAPAACAPAPATAAAPVNAKLAHCRQEHAIVSPRKRILRELERVSLEEHGSKRRAKTAPALSTASYPASPGPSHAPPPAPRAPPPAKHVSSYSIHSLLSMPDEAAPRRSPEARRDPAYAHSGKAESTSSGVGSPAPSPSPDAYRYVSRHGTASSPAAQGARDAATPPAYRAPYAPAAPPLQYAARAWPPPTYRSGGGAPAPRDEWARDVPYVYGYGYMPHVYRAPAPLWMHYAVPPAPSPWAPMALPLLTDHIPKDEPTSGEEIIYVHR